MKLPEMKTGSVISALAACRPAGVGAGVVCRAPARGRARAGLPVDIISDKQFSELTSGSKDGAKDKIGALVEKIGETKPAEDTKAKINEKREIKATKVDAEPPPPPPELKPDPKQAKKEPPKPDAIAETLKKEEAKKKPEPPEADPARSSTRPRSRRCSTSAMPQRSAATGDALNAGPSAGRARRQRRQALAKRDRRAAIAADAMLESCRRACRIRTS